MAVKIRLKRMGKVRAPHYRIVVADARTKRDGRVIEEIGKYHPKEEPSLIEVDSDRAQHWLSVGAQPTEAVAAILKITGDMQKFKGEPGTEGTLRFKEPKKSKQDIFNEILKEVGDTPTGAAMTKKSAKKADEAKAESPKAEEPKAEEASADEPKAEEPAAEPKAEEAPAEEPKAADAETTEA